MYIKKWKHLMLGIVILISIAIICACNRVENSEISSIEVINLKGIKSLENIVIDDENMLLVYPADARVSQEYTIVREVTKQGLEVSEYRIKDENFKRVKLHQKPSNRKTVYMTTFGEPILEDRYYTFNTSSHNITKHDLDYFDQKVGISHINHFGDNVLFQTIASHVTGDQAFNSETGEFKVSISDFSTQKGYETEYGYLPSGDSILGTNRYIYYSTTSKVNEDGEWGESYIAVIDKHNDETQYISYSELGESWSAFFSSEDKAYFISDYGKLLVLEDDGKKSVYNPFEKYGGFDQYSIQESTMVLDNSRALHTVYDSTNEIYCFGLLRFGENVEFKELSSIEWKEDVVYRPLYYDIESNEIYLIQMEKTGDSYLVTLSYDSLKLKNRIPIRYPHLLDFIIKK